MLPPSIVVELAERVRVCRTQLDDAEAAADRSRAEYNGYLELLTYAEAQAEPAPPAGLVAALNAWCECGLPGTPGMVHGITACTIGEPDPIPPLPLPAARERFPFQPFTPVTGSDVPA